MLDTVLAVTGGKPDPTTKAGRGAVAEGPEPGNAINPDGWENVISLGGPGACSPAKV